MKIKSFMFDTHKVNPYVSNGYACSYGSDYLEEMDRSVNEFCKDKDVVEIKKDSHCQGNNPPTYFIDITVIYK